MMLGDKEDPEAVAQVIADALRPAPPFRTLASPVLRLAVAVARIAESNGPAPKYAYAVMYRRLGAR
jgi:hypothetical protein